MCGCVGDFGVGDCAGDRSCVGVLHLLEFVFADLGRLCLYICVYYIPRCKFNHFHYSLFSVSLSLSAFTLP